MKRKGRKLRLDLDIRTLEKAIMGGKRGKSKKFNLQALSAVAKPVKVSSTY